LNNLVVFFVFMLIYVLVLLINYVLFFLIFVKVKEYCSIADTNIFLFKNVPYLILILVLDMRLVVLRFDFHLLID